MNRDRAIAAGSNWFAFAAALAVAFLLTPFLIRTLGPARYDIWCVVEAILAYFTLLDLGVGAYLVTAVARGRRSTAEIDRVTSASLAIFSVAGAVVLAVGVPLAIVLAPRLGDRIGDPADATGFMLVMLVNLAVTLPTSLFGSMLEGLERYVVRSIVKVIALAVRATGYVLAARAFGTLLPLAVISLIVTLLEAGVSAWCCRRAVPGWRPSRATIDRATLREVRGYSWHAFLAMLAGRITLQTGAVVVGLLLPTGQVTAFATAARLIDYAKTLLRTVTATLTPGIAALDAVGDRDGIRRLVLRATAFTVAIAIPLNVGLLLFGRAFLTRWVGAEIADAAFAPLAILASTVTIGVAQSAAARVLYGLGRLKGFARLALAEAAVNLALTLFLIGPLSTAGVALAVAAPNALFCVATIAVACRAAGIAAKSYAVALARPVAVGLVPTAIWLAIGSPAATWPSILGFGAAGLAAWGAVWAFVALVSPGVKKRRPLTYLSSRQSASGHLL